MARQLSRGSDNPVAPNRLLFIVIQFTLVLQFQLSVEWQQNHNTKKFICTQSAFLPKTLTLQIFPILPMFVRVALSRQILLNIFALEILFETIRFYQ